MSNQTLQRVLNAVSFREAGSLHQQLRQGQGRVPPETRKLVQHALRSAGLVAKKTAREISTVATCDGGVFQMHLSKVHLKDLFLLGNQEVIMG